MHTDDRGDQTPHRGEIRGVDRRADHARDGLVHAGAVPLVGSETCLLGKFWWSEPMLAPAFSATFLVRDSRRRPKWEPWRRGWPSRCAASAVGPGLSAGWSSLPSAFSMRVYNMCNYLLFAKTQALCGLCRIVREAIMARPQHLRRFIVVASALLFPVTMLNFSPGMVFRGARLGVLSGRYLTSVALFVAAPACGDRADRRPFRHDGAKRVKYAIWVVWLVAIVLVATLVGGGFSSVDPFLGTETASQSTMFLCRWRTIW
jgi:hypothetical protein